MDVQKSEGKRTKKSLVGLYTRINWQYIILVLIMIVSIWMNFYNQSKEGNSNSYYTAAVTSMLQDPKAFFYASLDTGLYVTVDKPPLGLWIQTLSCALFGVNSFGILFPQALAGCISVLIMFFLVRKRFGDTAGLVAAAVIAFTPILIALDRTNNMDIILMFFLLCSGALSLRAIRTRKVGWWLLAIAFIGFGFNVKMLEAYMALPAVFIVYWVSCILDKTKPFKVGKLFIQSLAAVLVLVVSSFTWAVVVDLTDPDERPYIGSSENNSVLDLAFGYNGLTRLLGRNRGGNANGQRSQSVSDRENQQEITDRSNPSTSREGGRNSSVQTAVTPSEAFVQSDPNNSSASEAESNRRSRPNQNESRANGSGDRSDRGPGADGNPGDASERGAGLGGVPGSRSGGGGGGTPRSGSDGGTGGNSSESGETGVLRLFSTQLSGLISWFLFPAILTAIGACVAFLLLAFCKRCRSDQKEFMACCDRCVELVFWAAWLIPMVIVFSFAGFIHRYYVVLLAPAIAALTGACVGMHERHEVLIPKLNRPSWFMPVIYALTLGIQIFIVSRTDWNNMIIPMLASGVLGLVVVNFTAAGKRWKVIGTALMSIAVFLAPISWSFTPVLYTMSNANIPDAGPSLVNNPSNSGGANSDRQSQASEINDAKLTLNDYILQNYQGERWAVAVAGASEASSIIIATKLPVMAIGGWSGDSILTLEKLQEYVENGDLRYFVSGGSSRGISGVSSEITAWVQEVGTKVEVSGGSSNGTLYDLSNVRIQ